MKFLSEILKASSDVSNLLSGLDNSAKHIETIEVSENDVKSPKKVKISLKSMELHVEIEK